MPNGQPDASGFNRTAEVLLGATANKIISVGITTPKRKIITSIHIGVGEALAPATIRDYIIKVAVCSSPQSLLGNPTILDFNPLNSPNSENTQLGTVYYKNVIRIPYNSPIVFDDPILFTEGDVIYVIASIPYANGDSLLTVQNRGVYLSVDGHYIDSDQVKYKFR